MYDDPRVIYPQLMTAAHRAESKYEDRPGIGIQVRSMQAVGGDKIITLKTQITQLLVEMQMPQMRTRTNNCGNQVMEIMKKEI